MNIIAFVFVSAVLGFGLRTMLMAEKKVPVRVQAEKKRLNARN